jgi:hypothetical protein
MSNRKNLDTLKALASSSKEGWLKVVLAYDRVYENYFDKNEEEQAWIVSVRSILKEYIPLEYKTGVHLLHRQASFMGEDICIQDGNITTTMHAQHRACGKYQVVNYSTMFCVHCQREINDPELRRFNDS